MKTLNLGIVAHVDAGKTSLTERLLYNAGVIGEHYQQIRGPIPERPRTDRNPLNRQQYLLRVTRDVSGC